MARTGTKTHPLRVALYLSQIEHIEDVNQSMVVDMARVAEKAGFDDIFMGEHIALSSDSDRDRHLRTTNIRGYGLEWGQPPSKPWLDAMTALAAVAGATERVRLCAAATIAPLRHPLASAKAIASLDVLSKGRLAVTPVGSWQPAEYAALGVDFKTRGRRLDEILEVWHAVWGTSPAAYEGEFFSFSDMHCEPKPIQKPGPALWFGGNRMFPALVRRLAKYGSGFMPLGFLPSEEEWAQLGSAMAEEGRSVSELEMIGPVFPNFTDDTNAANIDDSLPQVEQLLNVGVTTFFVGAGPFCQSMKDFPDFCEHVIKRFNEFR